MLEGPILRLPEPPWPLVLIAFLPGHDQNSETECSNPKLVGRVWYSKLWAKALLLALGHVTWHPPANSKMCSLSIATLFQQVLYTQFQNSDREHAVTVSLNLIRSSYLLGFSVYSHLSSSAAWNGVTQLRLAVIWSWCFPDMMNCWEKIQGQIGGYECDALPRGSHHQLNWRWYEER